MYYVEMKYASWKYSWNIQMYQQKSQMFQHATAIEKYVCSRYADGYTFSKSVNST